MAGRDVPPAEYYDGFPQLDNGIGLTRNFIEEWEKTDSSESPYDEPVCLDVVTGTAVAPVLRKLAESVDKRNLTIRIIPVANDYFGHTVNVSGLLTARDIMDTLQAMPGRRTGILLPESALRSGEDIFLDDVSLSEMKAAFPEARIEMVRSGGDYRRALTDWFHYHKDRGAECSYTWQSNAGYTKPSDG